MLKHSNTVRYLITITYRTLSNVVNTQSGGKGIEALLICVLTVSISTLAYFIHTAKVLDYKLNLLVADAHGNITEDDLTDSEVERNNALFDERITLLKEELAQEQEAREYESTIADEFHPGVTNLPHNKIPYDKVPDDEYAK